MKTPKMSLANIMGKLSRAEMKNIMAGSGSGCGGQCGDDCSGSCGMQCGDKCIVGSCYRSTTTSICYCTGAC